MLFFFFFFFFCVSTRSPLANASSELRSQVDKLVSRGSRLENEAALLDLVDARIPPDSLELFLFLRFYYINTENIIDDDCEFAIDETVAK